MRKKDVEIGKHYCAKISNKLTVVRILCACVKGWKAVNVKTKRTVRIRTAGKLRFPL